MGSVSMSSFAKRRTESHELPRLPLAALVCLVKSDCGELVKFVAKRLLIVDNEKCRRWPAVRRHSPARSFLAFKVQNRSARARNGTFFLSKSLHQSIKSFRASFTCHTEPQVLENA